MPDFRHTCEQHNAIHGYGWDAYDARRGGVQTIHDKGNGIDIKTTFVKVPDAGEHGGHWAVRISGTPRPDAPEDIRTAVVFYASLEGLGRLEVVGDAVGTQPGADGDVELEGESGGLGDFKLTVKGDAGTKNKHPLHGHASAEGRPLDKTLVKSVTIPENVIWQARCRFQSPWT